MIITPTITLAENEKELQSIKCLQTKNLIEELAPAESQSQGFLTVQHSLHQLGLLNEKEQHVIAKMEDEVVGYILAMTKESSNEIPLLVSMFESFEQLACDGRKLSEHNYIVVGQVCVAKKYRGTGLFAALYEAYKKAYRPKYKFALTEIATANTRSRAAHRKIGFKEIHEYTSPFGTDWKVVIWDWNKS